MTHLPTPKARFLSRLAESLEGPDSGTFVKLTLGHPSDPTGPLRKLLLRPVLIRGEKRCSVVSRFTTRDETKNLPFLEALAVLEARLGSEFLSAVLFTESEELHLELGKKARLRTVRVEHRPATLGHDRLKSRKTDARASYLRSLGVTDSHGKVRERMGDKFRQIERFVDLLDSAFRESELAKERGTSSLSSPEAPITLCDMGAGKGYLTFAACDYLQRVAKVPASVTGVELRDDLVKLCNQAAAECGFQDALRFVKSDIGGFTLPSVDILVALHACNTATDDALAAGIRAGAEIILAAPCCHKESRPQVDAAASENASKSPLSDVLRHGIFAERHAEMATDALRALLLERAGYRVRVSEFVAAEHTAKNVMLIATRKPSPVSQQAADSLSERIAALKTFYGIRHHRLEELLVE